MSISEKEKNIAKICTEVADELEQSLMRMFLQIFAEEHTDDGYPIADETTLRLSQMWATAMCSQVMKSIDDLIPDPPEEIKAELQEKAREMAESAMEEYEEE